MRLVLVLLATLLTGCGVLNPAGVAKYSATPVDVNGTVICCAVEVYNTKDIGMVHVEMEKVDGDYVISVYEDGIDATSPATAQAEANAASAQAVKAAAELLQSLNP